MVLSWQTMIKQLFQKHQLPRQRKSLRRSEQLEDRTLLTTYFIDASALPGGDGSALSPFNTIQAGIDAAANNMGDDTVSISAGTYAETLSVNDTSGNLLITGDTVDRTQVVIQNTTALDTMVVTASLNVEVSHLTIMGGDGINRGGARGIWYLDSPGVTAPSSLTVKNVAVQNHTLGGVVAENAGNLTVRGSYLSGNNNGIFTNGVGLVTITNVAAVGNFRDGAQVNHATGLELSGGRFEDNNVHGLIATNIPYANLSNTRFSGNDDNGVDLRVITDITATDVDVIGNGRNILDGFIATGGGIDNVTLTRVHASGNAGAGIGMRTVNNSVTIIDSSSNENNTVGLAVTTAVANLNVDSSQFVANRIRGVDLINVQSTVLNNIVSENNGIAGAQTGKGGGGIFVESSSLTEFTLSNSLVTGNVNTVVGAGIQVQGNVRSLVDNSTITNNFAQFSAFGGGFYSNSIATGSLIQNSTISNNIAGNGGGVAYLLPEDASQGSLTIENSTISGNTAGSGGGVYNQNQLVRIIQSTINDNSSTTSFGGGGGVYVRGDTTIENSTISGNSAVGDGGGITLINNPYTFNLFYSTVTNNTSDAVGGGLAKSGVDNNVLLANSIVAGNTAFSGTSPDVNGAISSLGYNLIGDSSGSTGFAGQDLLGTARTALDPRLGPLSDNGGATETHALLSDSPALDAVGPSNIVFNVDQRGVSRPQGSSRDIGAFELEGGGPINTAPVASNSTITLDEDGDFNGTLTAIDNEGDSLTYQLIDGPDNHFAFGFFSSGNFSYSPKANFNGTDTFSYRAYDGEFYSNVATVTINVTPVNDAPVAADDTLSLNEGSTLQVAPFVLLSNDVDVDGDSLSIVITQQPAFGSVVVNADGSLTYTSDPDYNGNDSFTYRASDEALQSNEATVDVTIFPRNDAPVAQSQTIDIQEDATRSASVLATDGDGDDLTYSLLSTVNHGVLTFNANGTYFYRPDLNYNGADSFTFTANDGNATSNIASVTLNITPVNDRPVTSNLTSSLNEDTVFNGQVTGTDADDDSLTYRSVTQPANGTVVFNTNGTYSYTPNADFTGTDEFYYVANDGQVDSFSSRIRLGVVNVNDAPVAVNDSFDVSEDSSIDLSLPITSFSFVGDPGEYISAGQTLSYTPENANIFASGSTAGNYIQVDIRNPQNTSDYWFFRIAAPAGETLEVGTYTGATRYPFQDAEDPGLSVTGQHRGYNTSVGEFTITQLLRDTDGTLTNFAATFWQASSLSGARMTGEVQYNFLDGSEIGSVLDNDTDIDSNNLTAILESGPQHGTLDLREDGTFAYTPDPDFTGVDSFTYRTSDGSLLSEPATVTLNVTPENDPPVVEPASYQQDEDSVLNGQLVASDIDGDLLSYIVDVQPEHGALLVNSDGSFTYTPDAEFNGPDSFVFHVNDGTTDSFFAQINLQVNAVNDAPSATDGELTLDEDQSATGNVSGEDIDGDALTFSISTQPTSGSVTMNPDGSFTYTPDANFNGTDSFTYRASDGSLQSNEATVSITVSSVNDAPVVAGSAFSIPENSPLGTIAGQVVANDVDGDDLSYSITDGDTGGAFVIDQNGLITVANTALLDFETTPSFNLTVQVTDGNGGTGQATVVVNLSDVNEIIPASISGPTTLNVADARSFNIVIDSTDELDINLIDIDSLVVTLETGEVFDLKRNKKGAPRISYADTNGDGIADQLIATFVVNGQEPPEGLNSLTISGLVDGKDFAGTDEVTIESVSNKGKGGGKGGGNGKGKNK